MKPIRINGIRLGHEMFYFRQYSETDSSPLIYQTLAREKINIPCLGMERASLGPSISCCLEGDVPRDMPVQPVCMISVYPHNSNPETLGALLALFGRAGIPFTHMVSSNAMVSFVIEKKNRAAALTLLEQAFDLPETHTPYEPGFHEETAAFVKKRYQETRAFFTEEKIKTYGFKLDAGLELLEVSCSRDQLEAVGNGVGGLGSKFYFTSAMDHPKSRRIHFYGLFDVNSDTDKTSLLDQDTPGLDSVESHWQGADLVSFHGPHFGDRFGIFDAAMECMEIAKIEILAAGCTGASIGLVLPEGQGALALPALEKGFDTP